MNHAMLLAHAITQHFGVLQTCHQGITYICLLIILYVDLCALYVVYRVLYILTSIYITYYIYLCTYLTIFILSTLICKDSKTLLHSF